MRTFTKRQQEIIDESIALIAGQGIQELTIKHIAERIGVSEPALYRHFNSKVDIILGMLVYFKRLVEEFGTKIKGMDVSDLDKVGETFLGRCRQFAEKPVLAGVIFSEEIFRNEPVLKEKVKEIMNIQGNILLKIVRHGQHEGLIRADIPAEHICHIVFGSLRLLVKKWRSSNHSFDLEEESNQIWVTLKQLIKKG